MPDVRRRHRCRHRHRVDRRGQPPQRGAARALQRDRRYVRVGHRLVRCQDERGHHGQPCEEVHPVGGRSPRVRGKRPVPDHRQHHRCGLQRPVTVTLCRLRARRHGAGLQHGRRRGDRRIVCRGHLHSSPRHPEACPREPVGSDADARSAWIVVRSDQPPGLRA